VLNDLGWPAWVTAGVMLLTLVALIREFAPPAQVLLAAMVILMVIGVVDPATALSGFSNSAMLTVGALFVVAGAVRKTGALSFLGRLMMPRSATMVPALARIMLPSSFLSSFLNNTPIVAFLTPMVQGWARQSSILPSKLLMPLSFATILGGTATLIGTSTNLLVSNLLAEESGRGLAMFELAWVGVPAAAVGFLYFATVGHRLLPEVDDQTEEARPRGSRSYQFDLRVPDDSELVGRTIEQAGLRHLEDAFLAHLRRDREVLGPVRPSQRLDAGDILTFFGQSSRMDRLLQEGKLARVIELNDDKDDNGEVPHLPLYEAVVSPESTLVGRSLKDSEFRQRFQGVVLGIHRRGQRVMGSIGRSPIEPGDLLLIEAGESFEDRWSASGEFYLVAPLERPTPREPLKARRVLAVLAAMIVCVTAGWLPMVSAAFGAAMLVVLLGALSPGDARRSLDLSVLVVIACALGLGSAIQQTGLAGFFAEALMRITHGLDLFWVLLVLYVCTNILTEVLTNSVAAVLVFPVGMAVAANLGLDPRVIAVVIAIAASASFATPIGYQTNLMVMAPGGYRYVDYVRVGLPLNVIMLVLTLTVVPRIWM